MKFLPRVFTVALGVWLAVLLGILVLAFAAGEEDRPLKPGTVLVMDVSLPMPDLVPALSPADLLQGASSGVPLHQVIAALEKAGKDKNICGLFMTGLSNHGWANLQALRRALISFKESGKPVHGSFPYLGESDYYLASLCDSISVDPLGVLQIDGFSLGSVYMAEALEKFGLQIQVTRVGKYKSAVESFLYSEMTPENEEQLRGILGSFQDEFFEVSSSREGCGEALAEIMATRGMVGTEDALAAGLIDKVQYWDQILDSLAEMSGEEEDGTFRQISMEEYAQPQSPSATNASIAVVFAQGVIVDGESSEGIGGDSLAYQLRQLRYTEEIKAVVLRVNSPGGSASASEVILREMELLKEDGKLVIVSMGNVAASGGYWIACKADAIVAERTTITGSIGVFGILPNFAEAASRLGLHEEVVKTGPFADLESMWRPKSDLELQVIQSFVDGIYDGFLERVSDGRGMERDAVHEIAQGRVWSGEAALDRGLVDQLGGLQDAIALAKEKLGDADASVMYDFPELDPLDEILAQILEELPAPLASLKALPLDEVQLWLAPFQSQKGWQCWARLPFLINLR